VFKFVKASIQNMHRQKNHDVENGVDAEISDEIIACINSFTALMKKTSPTLIVAQTLAVKVRQLTVHQL
jgi:hypothetical protein